MVAPENPAGSKSQLAGRSPFAGHALRGGVALLTVTILTIGLFAFNSFARQRTVILEEQEVALSHGQQWTLAAAAITTRYWYLFLVLIIVVSLLPFVWGKRPVADHSALDHSRGIDEG